MTTKRNHMSVVGQSPIIRPIGPVRTKIEIFADDSGVIQVFPWKVDPVSGKQKPMDPREMVLVLQKVVMDTTSVLFSGGQLTPIAESPGHGKENSHNDENV